MCITPTHATCNGCNTGTSALPDMYAWCPRAQCPRASADISGNAQVPMLQLLCYTFGTLKTCPNLLLTIQSIYIAKDSHCDYGTSILNSMTFIYTINPTSFDYGILLNVNEQTFCRFYRTGTLTMIDIIVSLIIQ